MDIGLLWNLYRLRKNILKGREQIKALQNKKLRKLLHYAYDHSPYYRETFERAGIRKENLDYMPLEFFPVTDKETFLAEYDRIVTDRAVRQRDMRAFDEEDKNSAEKYLGKYHIVHSSGSTGTAKFFLYDEKAWEQMLAGIVRGALWGMSMPEIFKLLKGRPRILYVATTDGRYGGALAVGDGIAGVGARKKYLDINMPMEEWTKTAAKFAPDLIIGYPSAIKLLAEELLERETKVAVKRIISCGEPLSSGLRSYLEQVFRCGVVNFYGASESLALGLAKQEADGMILFDDLNIIEVIDGELYITCLYNYAQPLIRYRLTDTLRLWQENTDGVGFSRADVLLCRDEDVMWFEKENGAKEFLHPLSVEGMCVEGLLDYQFVQKSGTSFEIWAQLSGQHSFGGRRRTAEEKIRGIINPLLREKRLDHVSYEVKFTDSILPDSGTGKKKLIVKKTGNENERSCEVKAV